MKKPKAGIVAIVGRPNAGKSTLLNQILKCNLSIVTPKPQTTRERVLGIYSDPLYGQILLVDTPGIYQFKTDGLIKTSGLSTYMLTQATQALEDADLIWWLVDPKTTSEYENKIFELIIQTLNNKAKNLPEIFFIFNKSDLKFKLEKHPIWSWCQALSSCKKQIFSISALKGNGISELIQATWNKLPEHPPFFNESDLSDRPMRFFVAEKIREQLYLQLDQELPYSCDVKVTEYKEQKKPIHIYATISVARDSQKGIVLGKSGQKIKKIGIEARKRIEELIQAPIYLGLTVKVNPQWMEGYKV